MIDRNDIEEVFIEGERVTFIDSSGRLQALDTPTSEEENRQIVTPDSGRDQPEARCFQPDRAGARARRTGPAHRRHPPRWRTACRSPLRKYTVKNYDLGFLVEGGVLSRSAAAFLWVAARANTTVLFSGPPGAGKTTLLSAYLRSVPADLCVRVCEEVRELDMPLLHGSFLRGEPAQP